MHAGLQGVRRARSKVDGRVRHLKKQWRGVRKRARRTHKHTVALRKDARRRVERAHRTAYRAYNARRRPIYGSRLDRVPSREELPAVLNRRKLVGEGAEIGVQAGKFSAFLLDRWHGRRLISIDPWLEDAPENYIDRANVAQDAQERHYQSTLARLERFGARSDVWRATSVEAAGRVPDGSLDFAYIDARHDRESVLEDLAAWLPKVRPGGILAGHDYIDGDVVGGDYGDFGVKPAVDAFFGERGIPVHVTEGREPAEMFPSWIVEVPAGH